MSKFMPHTFCIELIDCFLFGSVKLLERLNGKSYLEFPQKILPQMFNNLPLNLQNQIYFMSYGCTITFWFQY